MSANADTISGERIVSALVERGGFVVYRRHRVATILERGARAVAVPNVDALPPQAIQSVRQMSGLTALEFDALLTPSSPPPPPDPARGSD